MEDDDDDADVALVLDASVDNTVFDCRIGIGIGFRELGTAVS